MTTEQYRQMQKDWYNNAVSEAGDERKAVEVVGNFDAHEAYPYEQYLLLRTPDPGAKVALDFGCGPGRMMRRMAKVVARVDGADICDGMIAVARRWTVEIPNTPALYVIDGEHLTGIPDDTYDLVYSTIAFQHIASYEMRLSLLREFKRVLVPGGQIALQVAYTPMPRDTWKEHVEWDESNDRADKTNGYHDFRVTPRGIPIIERDLASAGLKDFWFVITPPPHSYPADWFYIYATATD